MQTFSSHIEEQINNPALQNRQVIKKIIADVNNREKNISELVEIIQRQSEIVYMPIPNGLKPGEPEKYQELINAVNVEQAAIQALLGIIGPDVLLDDEKFIKIIDKSGMLERLGRWQDHIITMKKNTAEAVDKFKLKHGGKSIKKVKIFGLGGSAAPHSIAAEIINNWRKSSTEIEVVRADTPNPDYIDENTLVALSSYSGNTEETINCYKKIKPKTQLFIALTQGGKLREIALQDDIAFIQLPDSKEHIAYVEQPRESVCLQMTAMLTFLGSIGLEPGSGGEFKVDDLFLEKEIIPLIQIWRQRFGPYVPFKDNLAKQLTFFLLYGIDYRGRIDLEKFDVWDKKIPFILVDRNNWAIGHEARTQFHERSKLNAAFYEAPEFLHNLVESMRAGMESSRAGLDNHPYVYYFIRSLDEEARIRLRLDKTIDYVMKENGRYAVLNVEGKNPYQRALFATYFNAHMTTYLAILNGFDPLPVPTMSWIKNIMDEYERGGKDEQVTHEIRQSLYLFSPMNLE